MEYISTRNKNLNFSFKDVFLKGLSSEGGLFIPKKIKKYSDSELAKINFPTLSKLIPLIITGIVKRKFSYYFKGVKTIKEFQSSLAPLVESMIKTTTSGFSVSGEENLLKIPTLYIGNHRDISLDPLFLNYSLFIRNMRI